LPHWRVTFLSLKAADKVFTADALLALQAHPWPGNIRELRNLVAKLAMATEDRQITGPKLALSCVRNDIWRRHGREPCSGAVPLGNL